MAQLIRKIYEAAYKTPRGDFHREVLFENELETFYENLEGDDCRLLYCREADKNDISVLIKSSDASQLRRIIELATGELSQRLISHELNQYRTNKYSYDDYKKELGGESE